MGDPTSRRNQTRNRLRAQLRKKRESLADQFDFKIYIAFVFKEKVSQKTPISSSYFFFRIFNSVLKIMPWWCFFIPLFAVAAEKEVCPFWSCWSGASDDQQLRRKHLKRCAGFQLLSREFYRALAKRCCATPCPTVPVNAKGKSTINWWWNSTSFVSINVALSW